jgi:ethanolamine utilization protein EutQ
MSKKQLVVAADVQAAVKTGVKVIHLRSLNAIVTAEARSLAKELGVDLALDAVAPPASATPAMPAVEAVDREAVRRVIEAQTHAPANAQVMQEVLRRIEQERSQPEAAQAEVTVRKITSLCPSAQTSPSSVNMSQLDLATLGTTTATPCASGFMGWSKNVFPFTRASDEINLVLEGELQYHVGQTVIHAKPGDVMWVPKGAKGKIGTLTSARYFYLSYPV